jgi:hypothetical protein
MAGLDVTGDVRVAGQRMQDQYRIGDRPARRTARLAPGLVRDAYCRKRAAALELDRADIGEAAPSRRVALAPGAAGGRADARAR